MSCWKATKKFFGRFSIRNTRVGPSPEDRLKTDPDLLECKKEMKVKSKQDASSVKRQNQRDQSKGMKDKKRAQAKGPIDIGIIDSKEAAPSISLSNVVDEPNEVKECQTQNLDIEINNESNNNEELKNFSAEKEAVSEISSNHSGNKDSSQDLECETEPSPKHSSTEKEDEFGKSEKSKSDEQILDERSEDEKSISSEGQEQPKKVPLSNNSGSNEDFWDNLAEEYMYGESEAGEFSFRCEDDVDDPKSEDSDLPEHDYYDAIAWIDLWVKKTVIWGSESETQSEGSKMVGTDLLNRLDRFRIAEPNKQYSIIAKTEDWYFSSDEDTRTLTSVDSIDSGLESEESKKEDLVIQDIDPISQSLDPAHQLTPDLEDSGKQTSSNLEDMSLTSSPENGTGVAPRIGFLHRCIGWISRKVRRRVRVAPAELFEPHVLSSPNSSNVKTEIEQCPSNSGKVNSQVTPSPSVHCQSDTVPRQIFSSPCIPDPIKTKVRRPRKHKVKRRLPSGQSQSANPSCSCKSTKVKTEKKSSHSKPRSKMTPIIPVESLSGKSSCPRELAIRQDETSPCNSIFGEVTLRRRKERAGSQGWIRYPNGN